MGVAIKVIIYFISFFLIRSFDFGLRFSRSSSFMFYFFFFFDGKNAVDKMLIRVVISSRSRGGVERCMRILVEVPWVCRYSDQVIFKRSFVNVTANFLCMKNLTNDRLLRPNRWCRNLKPPHPTKKKKKKKITFESSAFGQILGIRQI